MASPLVEFKNVTIGYADTPLTADISFQVRPDSATVVVGPSGVGKTSLLKTAAGLLPPLDGQVFIDGQPLYGASGAANTELMKRLGMLFQKNALFDSMTAAQNLRFPLKELTNLEDSEIEKRIDWYLDAVGLANAKSLFPSELSGGMQKRLGIARALALKPQVVLYDDPTAGLDPITSRKIVDLIIDLKKKGGGAALAAVNDMNRAYQLADQIIVLIDLEAVTAASAHELQSHPDPRVQQFIHGKLEGPLFGL